MQTQSASNAVNIDADFTFNLLYQKARRGHALTDPNKERQDKLRWRQRPDLYASERLNINLTNEQKQILFSIRDNRRTAVKAHHALGKTFVAAIAALWWIDCWDEHICYITAPTWSQALGLTFKQAKRLCILNNLDFQILESGLIKDKDSFKATARFIRALNADTGEGFQGEHTSPILIICDEATGIPPYIYDAANGLMTESACRQVEVGNPTDEACDFGDHCSSPNYEVFSYSALDHPNIVDELQCKPIKYKGAVSLTWLFEMLRDEAETTEQAVEDAFEFYTLEVIEKALNGHPIRHDSPKTFWMPTGEFQGRVLGEFPTEASTKVIPRGWLKYTPTLDININNPIQLGVDVARFGDDRTTIFGVIGSCAVYAKELRKFDHLAIVNAVKEAIGDICNQYNVPQRRAKQIAINIDITGGLGTAPYDLLKSEGYNAIGINSSEKANNEQLFKNKRSELWFVIRDRAKAKNLDYSRLHPDIKRKLEKELTSPEYKLQGGKKVVEEKADMKKRLSYSPDLADGFNLAYYQAIVGSTPSIIVGRTYNQVWNAPRF